MRRNNNIDRMLDAIEDADFQDVQAYEMENAVGRVAFPSGSRNAALIKSSTGRPSAVPYVAQNNVTPVAAAQFDLNVKRLTTNIAQDLPVVLFGSIEFESAYNKIIQLPAGVTLTLLGGTFAADPTKLIFRYTSGLNVDDIEVTCNQANYTTFLQAMNTDLAKMSKIRYRISDVSGSNTDQFTKEFTLIHRSLFGKLDSNSLSIGSNENPGDFKDNIVDVNAIIDVDKETSIRLVMRQTANFTVTLSSFVQHFRKHNAYNF